MTFVHPNGDTRSERLLLVVMEREERVGMMRGEWRHIRATIIRRAVPHRLRPDAADARDSAGVEEWHDDWADRCAGYRTASYQYTKTSHIYVDGMELRGQIDALPTGKALNKGRPYGNSITFKPYSVGALEAKAIGDFYKKYTSYTQKRAWCGGQEEFPVHLERLSRFLNISRFVFYKPNVDYTSLETINNLNEVNLTDALAEVEVLLKPFATTEN